MEFEEFIAPSFRDRLDRNRLKALEGEVLVIKYGGNAMKDPALKHGLMNEVAALRKVGAFPVLVHGGGPFIQRLLDEVGMGSDFHGGHRRTTEEAMKYVEMALKGEVNGDLVEELARFGVEGVGLSGKDGGMVGAVQRYVKGEEKEAVDLGHVGDVEEIDPTLLQLLLKKGYLPVLAPIALGPKQKSYNVNADMFAGHIAGALQASVFLVLTDVDGLMQDKDDPKSLIADLTLEESQELYGNTIQGGMIPKMEACEIALKKGVQSARIVNGTRQHVILRELASNERSGTRIYSS